MRGIVMVEPIDLPPVRDWLFITCATHGHDWVTFGGRPCPLTDDQSACPARNLHCSAPHGIMSQPVFRCSRCPAIDFGEPGGPGYAACLQCMAVAI